jgi:hypothetical protein
MDFIVDYIFKNIKISIDIFLKKIKKYISDNGKVKVIRFKSHQFSGLTHSASKLLHTS